MNKIYFTISFSLSVSSEECARKFSIPENCKDGFEKMVEEIGKMPQVCQKWGIANIDFYDEDKLRKFRCVIGNDKSTINFIILSISI